MFGIEPYDLAMGDPVRLDFNMACFLAMELVEQKANEKAKETKNQENEKATVSILDESVQLDLKKLAEEAERRHSRG